MLDNLETVKTAIETHPNIWLAFGIAVSPFITVGSIALFVVRYLLPSWEAQQKLNREHLTELLKQRSDDANQDVAATRELAKTQNASLQEKIELKIDRLDERTKNTESMLRSIAAKLGTVVILVLLLSFVFSKNVDTQVVTVELRSPFEKAVDCEPECPKGFSCCGHNKCCEDSSTASQRLQCSTTICGK